MNSDNVESFFRSNKKQIIIIGAVIGGLAIVVALIIIIQHFTSTPRPDDNISIATIYDNGIDRASAEEVELKINENLGYSQNYAGVIKGDLVADGTWYVGVVALDARVPRMKFDQYKIILHKVDDIWVVAANQAFVFKYDNFPEIPREIIKFANEYEV